MTLRLSGLKLAASAILTLCLSNRASAGLLDSPAPPFGDGPGKVVYRMGPVYYQPGRVDTEVTCTNLAGHPTPIAFEIFDEKDMRTGKLTLAVVAAGDSVTFSTSPTPDVPGAVSVTRLPPIAHGKARVIGRVAEWACSGQHRFQSENGTVRRMPLALVKRVAFGNQ